MSPVGQSLVHDLLQSVKEKLKDENNKGKKKEKENKPSPPLPPPQRNRMAEKDSKEMLLPDSYRY